MKNLIVLTHARGAMAVNAFKAFLKDERGEFNDGGSTNWARNAAIGLAIAAILLGLVTGFLPELFNVFKAKVLSLFN